MRFHHGAELTAADVSGIRAVDRYTLEIRWIKPYVPALEFCPLYTLEHFVNREIDCIPMYSQQNRVAMQSRVQGVAVPHLGMYY